MPVDAALGEPADTGPGRAALWPTLQARWVDRIKRAALRQLHASAGGERLLLRMYLAGEEATELALQDELVGEPPQWLALQMETHLAEERAHARAFALALAERGVSLPAAPTRPDGLSRRKIEQWHRLARRQAAHFANGMLVPAFAIGLCAEQMAARVLARHCRVIGAAHPFHPLLSAVLADESRHVRLCRQTLDRIVGIGERERLATLLEQIRRIERAFGVSSALAMLAAGLALRAFALLPRR